MIMILRNFIFYLGVIPATVVITTFTLCVFFAPFKIRYYVATSWSHFVIFWAKVTCGLSYQIEGREHLSSHSAIIVSNHQSTWETIFMQVLLPVQSWVLKRELLYIPFFGWGLYLIEPIAIQRNKLNSVSELIRQGTRRLQQGRFVVIFPEGTRVAANHLGRFSRTAAALATTSQFSIVPIAHNAGHFWPRGFFIRRPGTIIVRIGPAISPEGKTATELNDITREWIASHLPNG